MSISINDRIKLKKLIKKLSKIRGRHTELISVYLPAGADLTKSIQGLMDEQGTATNIKDKNTGKAVIASLERMIRTMRTIDKTPANGLAIFSGNVSERDNVDDYQVFWVEPPQPMNQKLYRCDQRFVLEPLVEMSQDEAVYGLLVMDRSEATIGLLIGSTIKVINEFQSLVPGKHKTGGQSAQRFERNRENETVAFYYEIADAMTTEFTFMKNLKGIIIGGPGTTKNKFYEGDYLNQELKKKVLAVKDNTYTNDFGLKELVGKSGDTLAEDEIMTEKKIGQEFLLKLAKEQNFVTYGVNQVREALDLGAVDRLIIVEDSVADTIVDELTEIADKTKTKVILITNRTPEAIQLQGLTGICAILRFPIHN
jgi:peptide chain release factor subunit 1